MSCEKYALRANFEDRQICGAVLISMQQNEKERNHGSITSV